MQHAGDVEELCLAAGLDPAGYLSFAGDETGAFEPPIVLEAPVREAAPVSRVNPRRVPDIGFEPALNAVARERIAAPLIAQEVQRPAPMPAPMPMLHFATEPQHPVAETPFPVSAPAANPAPITVNEPRRRTFAAAARPVARRLGVALCSAAGGGGATTIAATLARLLASRGEHIVIGDASPLPMLPMHFGATHLSRGTWSLLPGRRRQAGAVHIVSNTDLAAAAGFGGGWLENDLKYFPHPWNRMLLDAGSSGIPDFDSLGAGAFLTILVAHPSPTAQMRLQMLLEEFPPGCGLYVLLNRFDSSNPAHQKLRGDLEASMPGVVLPFQIRESAAVPEALMEGLTVDEYAQDAEVTADFSQLANWIQAHAAAAPNTGGAR